MAGDLELPPPNLSQRELEEFVRHEQDKADRQVPREVRLPEMAGAHLGGAQSLRHHVFAPVTGEATEDYLRLYRYFWFACQYPDRPTDEAMLIEAHCRECSVVEWGRRGLPVSPLPPLPADAPILRD